MSNPESTPQPNSAAELPPQPEPLAADAPSLAEPSQTAPEPPVAPANPSEPTGAVTPEPGPAEPPYQPVTFTPPPTDQPYNPQPGASAYTPPTPPNAGQTPPPYQGYALLPPLRDEDQRLWATLIHVGGIFFSFVPALVGYLVLKDRGAFVREHTATALNFQLTMLIGYFIGGILTFILIGYLVIFAIGILILVFSIMAALAANSGQRYTYPLSIKFLS